MITKFITGQAGTGKTYQLKQRLLKGDNLVLAATTGIAATNLGEGVTTIHSYLKFFDYESLKEKFEEGKLTAEFRDRIEKEDLETLAIDEVSMLDGRILDLLYESGREAEQITGREIELVLTGDFMQLGPVKAPWAFEADCWPEFEKNTTKLTKIWRQDNVEFINALNCLRKGEGVDGARILKEIAEVEWASKPDDQFDGATIIAKNADVDNYNQRKLAQLKGPVWTATSYRWAADSTRLKDWNTIPQSVSVKPDALVMLRANDTEDWEYANGSLARVKDYNGEKKTYTVQLLNGKEVTLRMITRKIYSKERPERFKDLKDHEWPKNIQEGKEKGIGMDFSYWDTERQAGPRWCVGECSFYPMTLAWAITVHRSQGLTLDRVQIDLGPAGQNWHFMGTPGMVYVSLSRAKSPNGLKIVGNPLLLAKRCKIESKVKQWL